MNAARVSELEAAIGQLPGIQVARVSYEDDGKTIAKIHVLVSPDRVPKRVVRDVESFLLLRFGIRLDYRKISLVQGAPDTKPAGKPRPRLLAVWRQSGPGGGNVGVRLESEDREYVGSSSGVATTDASKKAAHATLDAVRPIIEGATVRLADVKVLNFGDQPVTVVGVTIHDERGEEDLLGVAYVRNDPLSSAARATLDALNRYFFGPW